MLPEWGEPIRELVLRVNHLWKRIADRLQVLLELPSDEGERP
jgi:hypothetical protein